MTAAETPLHELPGPVLLLAGPGTGKTYQLAKRVKYLIEEKAVSPDEIAIITFTAAAAHNMRERISDPSKGDVFVPPESQPKMICTMHSLGHRILREKAKELGLKSRIRVVFSDRTRSILLGDAAQLAGLDRTIGQEAGTCRQLGRCESSQAPKCQACRQYESILRKCSAVDHDDQILLACRLLKEHEDLRVDYQARSKHILVDEYQDINAGQHELIKLLSTGQEDGLFVVGDDDQSIYSWRGGSPEFIRSFERDFGSSARRVSLDRSFRCHPHVLESALRVVEAYDRSRLGKGQFSYQAADGPLIEVHNVPTEEREASVVRAIVESALPSRGVLILVPHRRFAATIAQELKKARIRYSAPLPFPGEGLPLVSTLSQWLADPMDSLALRDCIEAYCRNPQSGIPSVRSRKAEKIEARESALQRVSELWADVLDGKSGSLWEALEVRKDEPDPYARIHQAFAGLQSAHAVQDVPAAFVNEIVKTLVVWRNPQSFLDEVDNWVEVASQLDDAMEVSGVRLMTLQGAKGLEADVVCLVGLEEGTLPRDGDDDDLAEQSRLMFVSMTRAKGELHLFHARKRPSSQVFKQVYAKGRPPDIKESRFLASIPADRKKQTYHQSKTKKRQPRDAGA